MGRRRLSPGAPDGPGRLCEKRHLRADIDRMRERMGRCVALKERAKGEFVFGKVNGQPYDSMEKPFTALLRKVGSCGDRRVVAYHATYVRIPPRASGCGSANGAGIGWLVRPVHGPNAMLMSGRARRQRPCAGSANYSLRYSLHWVRPRKWTGRSKGTKCLISEMISNNGEVREWPNRTVSKTVVLKGYRGFESHPLRHLLPLHE